MGRHQRQAAASTALTVLATVLIAGLAYAVTRPAQPHPVAHVLAQPSPSLPPKSPPSLVVPTPGAVATGGLFVIDQDMADRTHAWMLVSDCAYRANPTCHNAVVRSVDGGQTWSRPVQVGPAFGVDNGDAPRMIRFLNQNDGFVYGHEDIYTTHDGGRTWKRNGIPGVFVTSLAVNAGKVWAVMYPCAKGTQCAYEVRSSLDAGRTWSAAFQLPADFSPELTIAFGADLIISSVPRGDILMTSGGGSQWHRIGSQCTVNAFRGYATTSDGIELWELCDENSGPLGISLWVSEDAGTSWSRRQSGELVGAALIPARHHVAFGTGQYVTFMTRDGGSTWTRVFVAEVYFATIHFVNPGWAWAIDLARNVWESTDGGDHWEQIGSRPEKVS